MRSPQSDSTIPWMTCVTPTRDIALIPQENCQACDYDVGDQLVITACYDITANNRFNPDPDQWVGIGYRTADEMSHAWIGATHEPGR